MLGSQLVLTAIYIVSVAPDLLRARAWSVQVGIVTFGPRCFIADSDFFPVGYYTSVMAWRDWIDEVVTSKYGFAPL